MFYGKKYNKQIGDRSARYISQIIDKKTINWSTIENARPIKQDEFSALSNLVLENEESFELLIGSMKTIQLPVTWEVCSSVNVTVFESDNTLSCNEDVITKAIEVFNDSVNCIPLPKERIYVDGSFKLSGDNEQVIDMANIKNKKETI